eukprot:2262772-Amphidinium_carterae.1
MKALPRYFVHRRLMNIKGGKEKQRVFMLWPNSAGIAILAAFTGVFSASFVSYVRRERQVA